MEVYFWPKKVLNPWKGARDRIVEALLETGADPHVEDIYGTKPANYATKYLKSLLMGEKTKNAW